MNCEWEIEQLSAYIDKEMGAAELSRIDEHVEHCNHCRAMVAEYRAIGSLTRGSEPIVDTDAVWNGVVAKLDAPKLKPATIDARGNRGNRWPQHWAIAALATAASIALLFFTARNNGLMNFDGRTGVHNHALAVDFQNVFRLAKHEPQQAISELVSKYQGRELSEEETNNFLGYEPFLFQSVPEGFTRVSTHVLNMPCCKCSATICQRHDGTSLIVFEHKDEQPVWFGDSPSIDTQCSGKSCKIVESAGQLAVSWKNEDRQLTMIGANDLVEVSQWVSKLDHLSKTSL